METSGRVAWIDAQVSRVEGGGADVAPMLSHENDDGTVVKDMRSSTQC
jgi:hypothetical protein